MTPRSFGQLDLQSLHRVRARLVRHRTSMINQIRALLLDRGIAVRQGRQHLRQALPNNLEQEAEYLSPRMVRMICDHSADWHHLDARVALTILQGLPRRRMIVSSSRVTRIPDNDVSATRARHSRVRSSTMHGIRKRRLSVNASDTNATYPTEQK